MFKSSTPRILNVPHTLVSCFQHGVRIARAPVPRNAEPQGLLCSARSLSSSALHYPPPNQNTHVNATPPPLLQVTSAQYAVRGELVIKAMEYALHSNAKAAPAPAAMTLCTCTRKQSRLPVRRRVLLVSLFPASTVQLHISIDVRGRPLASQRIPNVLQFSTGLNFDRIIYCNIGNPQQLQQKPITFFRQASGRARFHVSKPQTSIKITNPHSETQHQHPFHLRFSPWSTTPSSSTILLLPPFSRPTP